MKGLILLYLPLLSLAGAAVAASQIPRHQTSSQPSTTQTAFLCRPTEFEDPNARSQPGPVLNETTCDCATFELPGIIAPTIQRNVTDFTDTQQCSDYVLVSARGTGEAAGWSGGVHAMTLRTLEQVPNGAYYPVRYPAGNDVNTTLGSLDVVNSIARGLGACPNRTYVLYGASQGATVILGALPQFTDEMFNSVKAVVLVANPYRAPGKKSNVDDKGWRTPESINAAGIGAGSPGAPELPEKWDQSGKVIDICIESVAFAIRENLVTVLLSVMHLTWSAEMSRI